MNYEKGFCVKGRRPFHRVYFVYAGANSGIQFDEFISLCDWLCTKISSKERLFERDEFDDPNTVTNKLLLALRNLGFEANFSAQKLKVAHGEPVCSVIDFLSTRALEGMRFKWGSPKYPNDALDDAVEGEDDGMYFLFLCLSLSIIL